MARWSEADHPRDRRGRWTERLSARMGGGVKALVAGSQVIDVVPAGLTHRGSLTTQQRDALTRYASAEFVFVNGLLRRGRIEDEDDQQLMDEVIPHIDAAARPLPSDIEVWRGMQFAERVFGRDLDGDLTGFEWRDPAYGSTSADQTVADIFLNLERVSPTRTSVKMRTAVRRGTGAATISGTGDPRRGQQSEILIQRDAVWRVVADYGVHPDGYRLLDVEVAG